MYAYHKVEDEFFNFVSCVLANVVPKLNQRWKKPENYKNKMLKTAYRQICNW